MSALGVSYIIVVVIPDAGAVALVAGQTELVAGLTEVETDVSNLIASNNCTLLFTLQLSSGSSC